MKILKWIFRNSLAVALFLLFFHSSFAQEQSKINAFAQIDFNRPIRTWDGFGFNYVETSQTFNYKEKPQDYGSFSILKEEDKDQIIKLVFGDEGLKVSLVKMFLDPFHQQVRNGPYDHETTTKNMREFVRRGVSLTQKRGDKISIITTLYGPPGFMTKQKALRGRDLDPAFTRDLCLYYANWAKFLIEKEKLPLHYISLHNEGEDWGRWPANGSVDDTHEGGHDYNFFYSPSQTVTVIKELSQVLKEKGIKAGVTNGEYTNWYRFNAWGFAAALESDKTALNKMDLITSHGFYVGDMNARHWFGPHSSSGSDRLRAIRPDLHVWTTSTAWNVARGNPRTYVMDAQFIKEIHGSILDAKVNGIIPWAGIQRASHWNKPDPNPGCAIRVFDDGTWEIQKAYYYYKQVSRAGQRGMAVADAFVMDSELSLFGFSSNGTKNPNSFIVINQADTTKKITVHLKGSKTKVFDGFRTSGSQVYNLKPSAESNPYSGDNYTSIGKFQVTDHAITYEAPPQSVTTFFESK